VAYASNCQRFEFYGSGGVLIYEADPKAGTWITGRLRGAKAGERAAHLDRRSDSRECRSPGSHWGSR
jgi:hypothetical protein